MRANFSNVEQVDTLRFFANVEGPITVDFLSETMNWLVCLCKGA